VVISTETHHLCILIPEAILMIKRFLIAVALLIPAGAADYPSQAPYKP